MNAAENEFELLWKCYQDTFPCDAARADGFERVPEKLLGRASFPVSTGTLGDAGEMTVLFPKGGVMFVGHNCDLAKNYRSRRKNLRPHGGPEGMMNFWKGIDDLFERLETVLPRRDCFFTNIYPALVRDDNPDKRSLLGIDCAFATWCRQFLREQINMMSPTLLVVLGDAALPHVKKISDPTPMVHLSHPSSWKKLKNNDRIRKTGKKEWIIRGCTDYEQLVDCEAERLAALLRGKKMEPFELRSVLKSPSPPPYPP
jgi:hypothetical protein